MKKIGREVTLKHFGELLNPNIDCDHHSGQLVDIVASNVRRIFEEHTLFKGPHLDANVSGVLSADPFADMLSSPTGPHRKLWTRSTNRTVQAVLLW